MKPSARSPRGKVFAAPALIAAVTLIGLVVGLLGEGFEDVILWAALGSCLATIGWAIGKRG